MNGSARFTISREIAAKRKRYWKKRSGSSSAIEPTDQRAIYRLARRLAYLCDVGGQEEEAITHYETAIRAGRQLANVRHSDLGTMLNNLALIYRRSGRQKAAEPCYLHALELYEKHLGPEHPDVAAVLNNLGVFYTGEGRLEEAEQMHQRALAIRRKANPKGHPDIAQSNCNLAVVYHSRGDLARAGELYRESLRGMGGRGKTIGGLRNCGLKLCRSSAVVRQTAPGGSDRVAGPQKTQTFIDSPRDHGIAACGRGGRGQLTGPQAQRSRGGMADAYGSGPYGATRGGSTPLVSRALRPSCSLVEYLSTFFGVVPRPCLRRFEASFRRIMGEMAPFWTSSPPEFPQIFCESAGCDVWVSLLGVSRLCKTGQRHSRLPNPGELGALNIPDGTNQLRIFRGEKRILRRVLWY